MKKKYIIPSILILLFIIDMILVLSNNVLWFDKTIYNLVRSISNPFIDKYFIFITKLANTTVVIIILAILNIKLCRKDAIKCDILTITSVGTNTIIKNIIKRSRPDVLKLIKQGGYSFPSGHTMIVVTLYGYLFYLLGNVSNKKLRIVLRILLLWLIINICISRIYVGVHYASDIVGGLTLGLAELYIIKNIKLDRL